MNNTFSVKERGSEGFSTGEQIRESFGEAVHCVDAGLPDTQTDNQTDSLVSEEVSSVATLGEETTFNSDVASSEMQLDEGIVSVELPQTKTGKGFHVNGRGTFLSRLDSDDNEIEAKTGVERTRLSVAKVRLAGQGAVSLVGGSVKTGSATVQAVRGATVKAITPQAAAKHIVKATGKQSLYAARNMASSGTKSLKDTALTFHAGGNDYSSSALFHIRDTGVTLARWVRSLFGMLIHPLVSLKAFLIAVACIAGAFLIFLLVAAAVSLILFAFCSDKPEDIKTLVENINAYRDTAVMDVIYQSFKGETDPNGNPYGYKTLTGKKSNNMTHGVTWTYANGISNDTAEIISAAAVYFQQNWPSSDEIQDFDSGGVSPFLTFCKDIAQYALDVTARESRPYHCMTYGGCIRGYRSLGETISVKDYEYVLTHACSAHQDSGCGYETTDKNWIWYDGHGDGHETHEWRENGAHNVTVYFPVLLPAGASSTELTQLPAGATHINGTVSASSAQGALVLDNANLYKGNNNSWFYAPGEISSQFTVVHEGSGETRSDTYTVQFTNAIMIPWCPGTLRDDKHGHYDLDVTVYLTGYDEYQDPELDAPDGSKGGSGNLIPLLEEINDGEVARTVKKQNKDGGVYTSNITAQSFTGSVLLPQAPDGFTFWYDTTGKDTDSNAEWAELLYKMDWEDLYGVTDGIKCKTLGQKLTDEELQDILNGLGDTGDARSNIIEFALSCVGRFGYNLGSKAHGGPGSPSVGASLDCSGFVQYVYWACGYGFQATNTYNYSGAGDLIEISAGQIQPGDMRVVYPAGGVSGHVQMYLGGGSWIECAYGGGVCLNYSNSWMTARPCHYFTYVGF